MFKQRQTNPKPWGTLEDLLLASAVNRHGTASWDSVAMELHNRCSQSPSSLTPQDCRSKFYDLKRRFLSQNLHDSDSSSLLPMLDELRKIRVEELRRDVQRRDVLIVSLEMKVKRLEEERDPSFHEPHGGPDPDADADAAKTNLRPLNPAASEDDSDNRKNIRSPNESNSTSKKYDVRQNGVVEENPIPESVKISKITGTGPPRTGDKPGREWSFNGAAAEPEPEREKNWVAGGGYKERNWRSSRRSQTAVGDSNEAWESVSESKQEGRDGAVSKQQSSDVQSSGSLSQRKRCRNSSGEEPEVSPAKPKPKPNPSAVKSEALLKFLEIIRSHRLGSAFERRVRSQESDRYKNLIRQHIDLRTIRARVVKGAYADSFHPFFRDLLLLFNNAIIFFHTTSPENDAAVKLRALVLEEMNDKARKPQPTKPCTTAMVGCRKSDSVAAVWDVGGKKAEKSSREIKGKSEVGDCVEIKIYEKGRWKKGLNGRKKNGEVKHEYGGNELSSHDGMEVGMEKKARVRKKKMKKKKKKKQGAVRFLKRMRQNCSESLEEEEEEEEEEEDEEERKKEGIKREKVRGKRGVGRPAKKGERVKVKREEVSGGKPRKRSRR
ncbi:hypothetical protein SDJN02_27046 [Cucurbita argyrosperma subsp. argyrosperma]|nr:hypothetical protein SDJN02_27046 [Cucurbita argyrosperma subsp. argyrosperma]